MPVVHHAAAENIARRLRNLRHPNSYLGIQAGYWEREFTRLVSESSDDHWEDAEHGPRGEEGFELAQSLPVGHELCAIYLQGQTIWYWTAKAKAKLEQIVEEMTLHVAQLENTLVVQEVQEA